MYIIHFPIFALINQLIEVKVQVGKYLSCWLMLTLTMSTLSSHIT